MSYFLVFLYNLSWPLLMISIVGAGLLAMVSIHNLQSARGLSAALGSVALLALAAVFFSIPAPDYDVRVVEKKVFVEKKVPVIKFTATKVITKPSSYDALFKSCIDRTGTGADNSKLCHSQALAVINNDKEVVVKRLVRDSPYEKLFTNCNDKWTGSIQDMADGQPAFEARHRRMEFCHRAALEGSRTAILAFAKNG